MSKLATEEMTACPSCGDLTFNAGPCCRCTAKSKMLFDTKPFDLPTAFDAGYDAGGSDMMANVKETPLFKTILYILNDHRRTLIAITRGRIGTLGDHQIYTAQIGTANVREKLDRVNDCLERLTRKEAANA